MQKIRKETAEAAKAEGKELPDDPAGRVIDTLVEAGRPGRLGGAGFYDYVDGKRTELWPGLRETFKTRNGADPANPPLQDLIERMLFAEAIETQKCFDEGVLTSTADANIGSIFGIGFPAWTGGVHQYILGYDGPAGKGKAGFVARAKELAAKYGDRFNPPASLLDA
ncbi:fatty oxidation protein FadB [Mycobacteroides abscessus subsp. abscessus]|uniref:Fatty oxidation complex alpha subunit domain protein n=6 Tax=Mycobacteroides abscessus TaxID=36809 RepID=A0A829QPU4_9MYCO|nr:fatty oxidation complex alpha subunit domain protein [Mycobacteroides abscessus 1948]SHU14227.1 fatty oxidation protein FadB [Mycobacteroides abscessus subsp. abscessus]